jgi:hypothetical protein
MAFVVLRVRAGEPCTHRPSAAGGRGSDRGAPASAFAPAQPVYSTTTLTPPRRRSPWLIRRLKCTSTSFHGRQPQCPRRGGPQGPPADPVSPPDDPPTALVAPPPPSRGLPPPRPGHSPRRPRECGGAIRQRAAFIRPTASPTQLARAIIKALPTGLRNARAPTSTRSIGFCVIWVCNSSSSLRPRPAHGMIA